MLDILAKHLNSEPANLPFNGIDFYLRELCDLSPDTVELMLRLGHKELALETALEQPAIVSGMRPILVRFGADSDANVAARAIRHLAGYYSVLHAHAAEVNVTRSLNWDTRAISFELQGGEGSQATFSKVLYPREGSNFTDDFAWSLIDRVVDPTRRGALLPHELASDDAPAPFRLGSQLLFRFDRARIELQGDAEAKLWKRLEIHAYPRIACHAFSISRSEAVIDPKGRNGLRRSDNGDPLDRHRQDLAPTLYDRIPH